MRSVKRLTVMSNGLVMLLILCTTTSLVTGRNLRASKHKEKLSVKSDVEVVSKLLDVEEFKHHTYEEMLWYLKYFATKYSDIATLYDIGQSVQNRKLWVLEISSNPGKHQPGVPEVKLVSGIHGEEAIGKEILLNFIKLLCEEYDKDTELTKLVDNTRIHILPSINPDGYAMARFRSEAGHGIGHTNAHGVDLNRNFPDQFFPSSSPPQPETKAVENWIKAHPFILSASLHAGSLVVTYPYDDSPSGQSVYSATPDDDVFRHLAKAYSVHHPRMHLANPKLNCTSPDDHFIDGVTNGAKWLSVAGGMQDYNYVRSNCFEVTIQVGCDKFPNVSQISSYWEDNKNSLVNFVNQVHTGVKGFVKDINGRPIDGASVSVSDRQHPVTAAKDGDYWRLLVPGSYEIEAKCSGFKSQRKVAEVVTDKVTKLDFVLKPLGDDNDFQYDTFVNDDPREGKKIWSARSQSKINNVESATVVPNDITSDFSQESTTVGNEDRPQARSTFSVRQPASPEEEEDSSSERKDHLAIMKPEQAKKAQVVHKIKKKATLGHKKKSNSVIGSKITCNVRGKSGSLTGILKWRGFLPSLPRTTENIVAGIELTKEDKLGTDGSFMGKRYFKAPSKRGYFVKFKDCQTVQ